MTQDASTNRAYPEACSRPSRVGLRERPSGRFFASRWQLFDGLAEHGSEPRTRDNESPTKSERRQISSFHRVVGGAASEPKEPTGFLDTQDSCIRIRCH